MSIEQLHTINTSEQKTPQGAGVSRRLSWLPFPAARFAGQIRGERKNMIVRNISRKITVCRTCDGSMSIDEDEDGLHLKCTMCARSRAIRLPTIRLRATSPSSRISPTAALFVYAMTGTVLLMEACCLLSPGEVKESPKE